MKFHLFLLVALASLAIASTQQCNINEVYNTCGSCDQICNREDIACKQDCSPGCYCIDGYARSFEGGICIPKESCPGAQPGGPVQSPVGVQCPENEEYSNCGLCDQICNSEGIACSQGCDRPGCYCQPGYKRWYNGGPCIPENSCPRAQPGGPVQSPVGVQCPTNEEYNGCGGCDQICNSEGIACAQGCNRPGCYCQKGFIRSYKGGPCIPENTCKPCQLNEVYNGCGGCDQICNQKPIFCALACNRPGCYCRPGYKRSFKNGICIPTNTCPYGGK